MLDVLIFWCTLTTSILFQNQNNTFYSFSHQTFYIKYQQNIKLMYRVGMLLVK